MPENYEIDFLRLRTDLQALTEQLAHGELRDRFGQYDYRRVKALAAAFELWDYVSGCIVDDDALWAELSDEAAREAYSEE